MNRLLKIRIALFLIVPMLFCSCGQKSAGIIEERTQSREKIINVKLESIDEYLPPLNSLSSIYIIGDTLIIRDNKSVDKLYFAYNLSTQTELGWFGKFGGGPGELVNFNGRIFDKERHCLYGIDFGPMEIKKIDIRKALSDSTYGAEIIRKIDPGKDGYFTSGYYANDSTLYVSMEMYDTISHRMHTLITRYNLKNGEKTPINTPDDGTRHISHSLAIPEENVFFTFYPLHDKIRIYDFDGNLKSTIYGLNYKEKGDGVTAYFGSGIVGRNSIIYVIYNGKDFSRHNPQDVIVMDKNGDYIKTLHFDSFVWNIAYHTPTNRLYVSTDGESQFGYINLSDYDL